MDRFEYAIGLISLIVGLALADIVVSLHRLIKHRHESRWDLPAILAVTLVAFTIIGMWYDAWALRRIADQLNIWFYSTFLLEFFFLFLAASAVLPDERADGWDVPAYHLRQKSYLWGTMALFHASYAAHWFYFRLTTGGRDGFWLQIWEPLAPLAAVTLLIVARGPRLRLALLVFALAAQIGAYAGVSFKA